MKMRTIRTALCAALTALVLTLPAGAIADGLKRVMVFGGSISWGRMPVEAILPTTRYGEDVRWPGVLETELGVGFEVVNESLSGRTAAATDDTLGLGGAGLNGQDYLPAASATNMPLASGVQKNSGVATAYSPAKVLIVAPPPLGDIADVDWLKAAFNDSSVQKSKDQGPVLGQIALAAGLPVFDAGTEAKIEGVGGVHMLPDSHLSPGKAVAEQVSEILN